MQYLQLELLKYIIMIKWSIKRVKHMYSTFHLLSCTVYYGTTIEKLKKD